MTSRAKKTSNRRNAQLSTGPSEEARAWTKFNGLSHGCRSKSRILPGESEEDFREDEETWFNCLQPRDAAERYLVADVVSAYWFKRRAERAHFEAIKAHIEGAGDRLAAQVNADINRLFHDKASGHHCTYGTTRACGGGPRTSRSDKPEDATLPSELVGRLEGSAKGCEALAEHWRNLRCRLVDGLPLQSHDRLKLIRMLAKQPLDAIDDQRVWTIFVGSRALHPLGTTSAFEDLKTDLGTMDLEAFENRLNARWPLPFDASDTSTVKERMLELFDRNLERLEAKLEVYRGLAGEKSESTAASLAFDQSPDGERLRRFELASARRAQRCLDAFWKYRRETERAEEQGDRAEVGRDRAEDGGRTSASSVEARAEDREEGFQEAVGDTSSVENKNLTSEANGGLTATQVEREKQIAELSKKIERVKKSMDGMVALGIGPLGGGVAGGAAGMSAIEKAIFGNGDLLRAIS